MPRWARRRPTVSAAGTTSHLGAVVGEHGGVVVKGGGDGLLCTFDAASDALAAAIGMQQAIAGLATDLDVGLTIRIGVSIGDVTWEDGDCFGMPVVEAARLEGAAGPGEILASEYVRVMARGRGDVEFEDRGPLTLKGVPEPVVAYSVAWEPLRRVASRYEPTPYVGRDQSSTCSVRPGSMRSEDRGRRF